MRVRIADRHGSVCSLETYSLLKVGAPSEVFVENILVLIPTGKTLFSCRPGPQTNVKSFHMLTKEKLKTYGHRYSVRMSS